MPGCKHFCQDHFGNDTHHHINLCPVRLKVPAHPWYRLVDGVQLVVVQHNIFAISILRAEVWPTNCHFCLSQLIVILGKNIPAQNQKETPDVKKITSNPVERTAVLMRLPRMELHWKKKKNTPKNFAITASARPSSPSRAANLRNEFKSQIKKNLLVRKKTVGKSANLRADCGR